MSKMKKILALLMATIMTLAMCTTAFAATGDQITTYTSNITVNGLSAQEETTVNAYAAVTLVEGNGQQQWKVADWATDYIKLNEAGTEYTISDADALATAAKAQNVTYTATSIGAGDPVVYATSVTFSNVPVGAYVILASGPNGTSKVTYSTMVANTYDDTATTMAAKNVTVNAKTSSYVVDKDADKNFAGKGEEVTFTITTTFPTFSVVSNDNSYMIKDTPSGLTITGVESVTVGTTPIQGITGAYGTDADAANYNIDLSQLIGTTEETLNQYAGDVITVVYKATVTSDNGYSNTANVFRNNSELGHDDFNGYTGDITLTKYASDSNNDNLADNTRLSGAQFNVYLNNVDSEALYFTGSNGVYSLAKADDAGATQTIEVSSIGSVQIKGLGAGKYLFKETKAPDGYSINGTPAEATISEDEAKSATANVTKTTSMIDTKLSALPSTGGIGTTIFTIGGIAIMLLAAAMFFTMRRKSSK